MVNQSINREMLPPNVNASVFPHTLIVESINLRDLARFMIAPDQRDSIGVADFIGQQQQERLHGIIAPIHEIAHKQIIGLRHVTPDFEELFEVVELSVDVAADGDGRVHPLHVALFHENFPCLGAERFHVRLADGLALAQHFDPPIQVLVAGHFSCA